ncbi:hypothetical protein FRC03_005127 [Tulasnella sp. 419]|nr:hypothetical protein FRC03_005127 [Tulasnella sp. 419]
MLASSSSEFQSSESTLAVSGISISFGLCNFGFRVSAATCALLSSRSLGFGVPGFQWYSYVFVLEYLRLDPTEYSRIVGCTVLASYCVRQYVIRDKANQKAVFTAYLNSIEILERPPPPPGLSETLLSLKLAAICEAKQKHKDREAGVPVAQPQHSPDNAGVTDRNAAAGKGEETSRKRKR